MSGTSKLFAEIDASYSDRISTMTEESKMLVGLAYLANTPDLIRARANARRLQNEYNKTGPTSSLDAPSSSSTLTPGQNLMSQDRKRILSSLLSLPPSAVDKIEIEPPLYVDYGSNIKPEGAFYANYNTTILDCAEVRLGDGVLFGPNVSIYCGTHSVSVKERKQGLERTLPVSIGRDTWVGGGSIIMAGVKIGVGCTIGAGSVVTKDVPDWSVAAGSPCRVLRTLSEQERA